MSRKETAMKKMKINAECRACGATGLYSGMCEAEDEAVICVNCEGTGCQQIEYVPFTARKGRRGIKSVRRSRGSFIGTGVGGTGKRISYKEFAEGKMP